jgi:nucleoside-diphosphate-sugar epimerase
VESQLSQGHQVRAVDLNLDSLRRWSGHSRFESLVTDITEADSVRRIVASVDVVYHLASAHLNVAQSAGSYRAVNVDGTANLVEASAAAGVRRFVHCSTVGVYGNHDGAEPAHEDSPCRPTHIYERTKLEGERLALDFARRTGYPVVVVRPAWVYGPECPRTRRLLATVARGRFVVFGDGRTARHPLYISDAVRGLERCAEHGRGGDIYILAGPGWVTIEELIRLIAEVQTVRLSIVHLPAVVGHLAGGLLQIVCKPLRRQPPFSRRSMEFFLRHSRYDTSKARRQLGFEAEVGLKEGLRLTLRHETDLRSQSWTGRQHAPTC